MNDVFTYDFSTLSAPINPSGDAASIRYRCALCGHVATWASHTKNSLIALASFPLSRLCRQCLSNIDNTMDANGCCNMAEAYPSPFSLGYQYDQTTGMTTWYVYYVNTWYSWDDLMIEGYHPPTPPPEPENLLHSSFVNNRLQQCEW